MLPEEMKHFKEKHNIWSLLTTCLLLFYFVASGDADCPYPEAKVNMVFTEETLLKNEFPEGSEATLQCATGYDNVEGSGTATCTAGTWSETNLICKRKDCGSIKTVANMTYVYDEGTLFGATAYVYCVDGYDIVGPSYIECYASGWSSESRCEVVTCKEPPEIKNGTRTHKDHPQYQDKIHYSCDKGYILVGNDTVECNTEGEYSPLPPQCKEESSVTEASPTTAARTTAAPTAAPSTQEPIVRTKAFLKTTPTARSTAAPSTQGGDVEQPDANYAAVFFVILIVGLVVASGIVICLIMSMINYHNKKGSYNTRGLTQKEEL